MALRAATDVGPYGGEEKSSGWHSLQLKQNQTREFMVWWEVAQKLRKIHPSFKNWIYSCFLEKYNWLIVPGWTIFFQLMESRNRETQSCRSVLGRKCVELVPMAQVRGPMHLWAEFKKDNWGDSSFTARRFKWNGAGVTKGQLLNTGKSLTHWLPLLFGAPNDVLMAAFRNTLKRFGLNLKWYGSDIWRILWTWPIR